MCDSLHDLFYVRSWGIFPFFSPRQWKLCVIGGCDCWANLFNMSTQGFFFFFFWERVREREFYFACMYVCVHLWSLQKLWLRLRDLPLVSEPELLKSLRTRDCWVQSEQKMFTNVRIFLLKQPILKKKEKIGFWLPIEPPQNIQMSDRPAKLFPAVPTVSVLNARFYLFFLHDTKS